MAHCSTDGVFALIAAGNVVIPGLLFLHDVDTREDLAAFSFMLQGTPGHAAPATRAL
jgi:hypothetical protein